MNAYSEEQIKKVTSTLIKNHGECDLINRNVQSLFPTEMR